MTVTSGVSLNGLKTIDPSYVNTVQTELDGYYQVLKMVSKQNPVDVMQTLSAISARLTEIRSVLVRSENRMFQGLRTKEIDPLLIEVDRQFKFHSRIGALIQGEYEHSRGQI